MTCVTLGQYTLYVNLLSINIMATGLREFRKGPFEFGILNKGSFVGLVHARTVHKAYKKKIAKIFVITKYSCKQRVR